MISQFQEKIGGHDVGPGPMGLDLTDFLMEWH